ncbi:MAG: T9SS type A sorting domain-containing protein [Bacteroidales bacterium]|nr:T9SS type A sorting domain-containing protein [Bacteroidales bacterium]
MYKYLLLILLFISAGKLSAQLPSFFDSRNHGWVSSVKDQGNNCGSCWAFASCAAIESSWLRQGGNAVDLSEDNLIDCHGFNEAPCAGGSFYMTQALLSMHKGILSESADPYTPLSQNCAFNASFPPAPLAYVEEVRFLSPLIDTIKAAIMDHGAVASSMYFTMSNYNPANYKYYDSVIDTTDYPNAHCITIVGWNDTMSFSGATNPGGWIIKDSYGSSWANGGYFYCSFEDAGILSENAIFPVKQELPKAVNNSHVYAHDTLGWVDNFGYPDNVAYALLKYTLRPESGNLSPQQIKRIGTYAVVENTSVEIEIYRSKNGNTLSGLSGSYSLNCSHKGFYTVPVHIGTDTLQTSYYIKVKYSSPTGTLNPIPVEKAEAYHTTNGFNASSNSCWISQSGNSWTLCGKNTPYNFDPCIKLYTENASFAKMGPLSDTNCVNSSLQLMDLSFPVTDSVQWLVNNNYYSNLPVTMYTLSQSGNISIQLVAWIGNNSDTTTKSISVFTNPATPVISQNGNTLTTGSAIAYQWLDSNMQVISGATNQNFTPAAPGTYYVQVFNQYGCNSVSQPFIFTPTHVIAIVNSSIKVFPNPTQERINISGIPDIISFCLINCQGEKIEGLKHPVSQSFQLDLSPLTPAVYFLQLQTKNNLHVVKVIKQ